jgi:GAF domain-containing protein
MASDAQAMRAVQQENIRLKGENNSMRNYVERLQDSLNALTALQGNLENIHVDTNVYELINRILSLAMEAVGAENGTLMLLDEETSELVFVAVIGDARDQLMHYRLPKDVGIAGWVVKNKEARLVENVASDPHFTPMVDRITGMTTTSIVCVPMITNERVLGAIEVVNTKSGRPYGDSDKDVLALIAFLAALAIVRAEEVQAGA